MGLERCWIKYARTRKWLLKPSSLLSSNSLFLLFLISAESWRSEICLHIEPTFLIFSLPFGISLSSFLILFISLFPFLHPLLPHCFFIFFFSCKQNLNLKGPPEKTRSNGFGSARTELGFKTLLCPQNHHRFPPPPLFRHRQARHSSRFPRSLGRRAPQDPRLQARASYLHASLKRRLVHFRLCLFPFALFFLLIHTLLFLFLSATAISLLKTESQKCRPRDCPPVLEEFIPLKKERDQNEGNNYNHNDMDNECRDKKNWLSSVQLWNNSTTNNNASDRKQHHQQQLHKLENKVERLKHTKTSMQLVLLYCLYF